MSHIRFYFLGQNGIVSSHGISGVRRDILKLQPDIVLCGSGSALHIVKNIFHVCEPTPQIVPMSALDLTVPSEKLQETLLNPEALLTDYNAFEELDERIEKISARIKEHSQEKVFVCGDPAIMNRLVGKFGDPKLVVGHTAFPMEYLIIMKENYSLIWRASNTNKRDPIKWEPTKKKSA